MDNKASNGQPLPMPTRDRLRTLVDAFGQYEAADRLGIGAPTIARALAGLGVRRVTAKAITLGLDAQATASAT